MWLLNVDSLELEEFHGELLSDIPPYAILSHTWSEDEVSCRDVWRGLEGARKKKGFSKIEGCCEMARNNGLGYVWIDTCCIDKRNSAELSEAINSMYQYYEIARICIVYLVDVFPPGPSTTSEQCCESFRKSRWFRRGWTLQELIASPRSDFFASDWSLLGRKGAENDDEHRLGCIQEFEQKLSAASGVPLDVLQFPLFVSHYSIAQRMSWAASRQTKRPEDRAYSLMSLFEVNMPILYGEGLGKAFRRLQLEIMSRSTDQTIFAWRGNSFPHEVLARSPDLFADSGTVLRLRRDQNASIVHTPYHMTNLGLSINMVLYDPGICKKNCKGREYHTEKPSKLVYASLNCTEHSRRVWIGLIPQISDYETWPLQFLRTNTNRLFHFPKEEVPDDVKWRNNHRYDIYIQE